MKESSSRFVGRNFNSPNRDIKIRDIITTAPIATPAPPGPTLIAKTNPEIREMSAFKIKMKKNVSYFKRQRFTNPINYPKINKQSKLKIKTKIPASRVKFMGSKRYKNFSQNDLSSMLEILVKSSKLTKSNDQTPRKQIGTNKSKEILYDSFEDLSKGLVLIVSGENNIPQTSNKPNFTTKESEAKFDNSKE